MINNKGFTFIESLVASSLFLMMITTLIPIASLISNERANMEQQRIVQNELHDELQLYLRKDQSEIPMNYDKKIDATTLTFTFSTEQKLVKGCAKWNNVKKKNKQICLYGYPNKQ